MAKTHSISRVVRFLSAGGPGVLLYYLILYALTEFLGVWYMLSAIIAFLVQWSCTFLLQKFWTFQNPDTGNIRRQAGKYAFMAAGITISNLILLYGLVEYLKLWYLTAQVIATAVLTTISYFVTSRIFSDPIVS